MFQSFRPSALIMNDLLENPLGVTDESIYGQVESRHTAERQQVGVEVDEVRGRVVFLLASREGGEVEASAMLQRVGVAHDEHLVIWKRFYHYKSFPLKTINPDNENIRFVPRR